MSLLPCLVTASRYLERGVRLVDDHAGKTQQSTALTQRLANIDPASTCQGFQYHVRGPRKPDKPGKPAHIRSCAPLQRLHLRQSPP